MENHYPAFFNKAFYRGTGALAIGKRNNKHLLYKWIALVFICAFTVQRANAQTVSITANINWPCWAEENLFYVYDPYGNYIGGACNPSACYTSTSSYVYTANGVGIGNTNAVCNGTYSMVLYDYYGDGWNCTGTVTLLANGITIGTYSLGSGGSGTVYFTLPASVYLGCSLGAETAGITAASGCNNGTIPLGSGAYKDISIAANTYYNFTWANSSTTNGFCATPLNGNASGFTSNQTGWYSGTTTSLRVSSSRSSCAWTGSSSNMTYRNTQPGIGAVTGAPSAICNGSVVNYTANGISNGSFSMFQYQWDATAGTWNNWGTTNPYGWTSSNPGHVLNVRAVANNNGCTTASASVATQVDAATVGGSISGGTSPLCLGNSTGTMSLSGQTGSVLRWEKQLNAGAWSTIANTSTSYSENPSSSGTWNYRALLQNGTCGSAYSGTRSITVDAATVAGNISGGTTPLCLGSNTGTMSLTGQTGSVTRWEKQLNAGAWSAIATTATTYSEAPSSSGTWTYRALVQNGSCSSAYSGTNSIAVDATTVGGSISGGTTPLCFGSNTGTMSLTGQTGSVTRWEKQLNAGSWSTISNTTTTYSEVPSSSGTWVYRALISNGSCPSAYSSTNTITVDGTSVGGSISGGTTPLCFGNGTGTMTLSGNTGSVSRWEKQLNAGAWSTIANTTTTYSETPSSAGTWNYRALITNGTCSGVYSSANSIVVDATSVGGNITGGTSPLCSGLSTGTMSLSGQTGSVTRWEKQLNAGAWSAITNTSTTYSETPASAGTWSYRALVTSGTCSSVYSSNKSITVIQAPSSAPTTVGVSPTSACSNALPATIQLIASGGNPGTGGTANWYSDVNGNGCGVDFEASGSSPAVFTPSATRTYYVRYENQCGSTACQQVTFTVNPAPNVSNFATSAVPACSGSSATVTVNSSSLANNTYTVTYNLSGANSATGNTASMVFNAGTGTFNTSSLANSGSTTVTITQIQNVSCTSAVSSGNTASITVNPLPDVTNFTVPSATTVCSSSASTVTVNSSSLTNATYTVTYNLSGANTATGNTATMVFAAGTGTFNTSALNNTGATTLTITQLQNQSTSCSSAVSAGNTVSITVSQGITGLAATLSANPICEGTSLGLNATVTAGTNITWSWSGPNSYSAATQNATRNPILESNGEGVYSVTATNACGSVNASTPALNVHRNIIGLGNDATPNPICEGSDLSLTATYTGTALPAGDVTWTWSGPNGFTANTQNPTRTGVSLSDGGVYYVSATNACGTQTSGSPLVQIDPAPTAVAGTNGGACAYTGSYTITGASVSNASSYTWSHNGTGTLSNTGTLSPTYNFGTGETGNVTVTLTAHPASACAVDDVSTVVISINAAPAASASNTGPYVAGENIQLNSLPNSMTSYSWSGPAGFTAGIQNPSILNADNSNAGIYTVTVTDGNSCSATASTTVSVTTGAITWVGISDDWTTASNWNPPVVPNSCAADVIIPAAPAGGNFPNITSIQSQSVRDIEVKANARIFIDGNLNVCGNWKGGAGQNATIIGTGSVNINGSSPQLLRGKTQFQTLNINTAAGAQLDVNAQVEVFVALELEQGNLNVTNGALTFRSPSATQCGIINNFNPGFTGTLTGHVNAERYFDAPTTANSFDQHYIGSPISSPSTSQLGIHGTAGYVVATSNCYIDQLAPGSPSGNLLEYDESHGATCGVECWKVVTNSNFVNGKGYSFARTGSGTIKLSGTPNLNSTYTLSGLGNAGWSNSASYNITPPFSTITIESGWHLVSNPYLANLDIQSHAANSNFDAQVQVWQTTGPYAGSYQPYTSGVDALIAPFQAFMIHKTNVGGTADYTLYADDRSTTSTTFYRQANDHQLKVFVQDITTGRMDVTTVAFNTDATSQFDPNYDANKLLGDAGRQTLYTKAGGQNMAININRSIDETPNVPMAMRPGTDGTFKFTVQGISSFDPTSYIFLEDKVTGQWVDLRQHPDYTFTMTTSESYDRFVLHFTPAAIISESASSCDVQGVINVEQPGTANWHYAVVDANNAVVTSGTLNQANPAIAHVNAGVYTLLLSDYSGYSVLKTVQVSGPQPVDAGFNVSNTTPEANEDIQLFSNSTNGTDFYWEFSDGSFITDVANPVYSFAQAGIYTVSLTVENSDGCVATSTQTITVNQQTTTGITNATNTNGIKIWSNGNRVMVDMTAIKDLDAEIEMYNALGQLLYKERTASATIYTKQLDISAGYVVVKVNNNNNVVMRKVFISNQ